MKTAMQCLFNYLSTIMDSIFAHIKSEEEYFLQDKQTLGEPVSDQTTDPSKESIADLSSDDPQVMGPAQAAVLNTEMLPVVSDNVETKFTEADNTGVPQHVADSPIQKPADPSSFDHLFRGKLGGDLENLVKMYDAKFDNLVANGSMDLDHRFIMTGESVWDNGDHERSMDRLALGEPSTAFRQIRYFDIRAMPGDGIVVMDFWIAENQSGGFLAGDSRGYINPLDGQLCLDDSRMIAILDRENGRAMVTIGPTTIRTSNIPESHENLFNDPFFQRGTLFSELVTVPARPIILGTKPDSISGVLDNYFQVATDENTIVVDYEVINIVSTIDHTISVNGPIELVRGGDGMFQIGTGNAPNDYPSIAVVQYLPDGQRKLVFQHDNVPVITRALEE